MRYQELDTPTGPFTVRMSDEGRLTTGWIAAGAELDESDRDDRLEPRLVAELVRYFAGAVDADFLWVPLPSGPAFFRQCWAACLAIPRGQTLTYAELAIAAGGGASAARAAGQSMRRNPMPIVIPCHRVQAAGGGLGGFSGCIDPDDQPLRIKRWLLRLEGALPPADRQEGLFDDWDRPVAAMPPGPGLVLERDDET